MPKIILKPKGKIKIDKFYINKRNGQMTCTIPKKKLKSVPTRGEFVYW